MKKLSIVLLITLCFPSIIFSQLTNLDSVVSIIENKHDTVKVQILIDSYLDCENNNIQEGLQYLNKALEIAEDIKNEKWTGKVLMKYGNFYNITGDYEKALEYYTQSKGIFNQLNLYQNIGSVYANLGNTYEKLGRYDDAMDNLIKALSVYELDVDSLGLAKTYLNLGLLYFRQEDYGKSMELYEKSLEIRKEIKDTAGIALIYNNMAIVNYYTGDYDNVRSYFEKAYQTYVELGHVRRQLMALSNLAEILNIIGQKEKALEKYFKVLELEKELGQKGEQANTYILIGDLYRTRKDFINAKKNLGLGIKMAKEIGSLRDIENGYTLLFKIYKEEKNYNKALEYYELYSEMHDSIYNAEKSRQIQEIETQYETKKKEQQIKNLENEKIIQDLKIKKQKIFLFSFFGGFISISIFLLILFRQNKTIRSANTILAYQKKQITDSIEYASRIQTAILPPGDYIERVMPEHFILYKPRDIVSGDFYWITHKDGKIVVAAVDCTGHGVPGAFMSMLGFAFLNEIVNKEAELKANLILNQLRDYVKSSLRQTGKDDEAKDGMDIALCIIDPSNLKMQYAGAYNPLYLIRNQEFISLKADRMPIGIHILEKDSFTNHEIDIKKEDVIYIFTDGYIDQFGGEDKRKFKISPFRELLININNKSMNEQKQILEEEFYKWKGEHEQIDDILVMGIKI